MTHPKPIPKAKPTPADRLSVPLLIQAIAPGSRVRLKSGRYGVAIAAAWLMPRHTLVEIDQTGDRQWILTQLLEVINAA